MNVADKIASSNQSIRFFFQVGRFMLGAAAVNNSYYCIPSSQMSFEKQEGEPILSDFDPRNNGTNTHTKIRGLQCLRLVIIARKCTQESFNHQKLKIISYLN